MRNNARLIIGLSIVAAAVLIAVVLLSYYLAAKSFPKVDGKEKIHGLTAEATIYRDEYGVPHIFAESDHDAYIAVGYVHAQERLWQMELERRVGLGRLSEILGRPAVSVDKMFRTLGLYHQVQKIAANLDQPTRDALQAYADGVNQFIASHAGKYPLEFDMLSFEPEPWTIEHSLLISRLMAWEMNFSRWNDLLLAALVARLGEEKAKEVFPWWPADAPLIIPEGMKDIAADLKPFFDADHEAQSILGINGMQSGSNAWVVSGAKSETGKPIVANDPHLVLMAPARWYELHIVSPEQDVAGMSIPGVPFVIAGRNKHIAWGITNAMMDDEDFYIEQVDSIQRPSKYMFNGSWQPVTEEIDTIFVKGSSAIFYSVFKTHHGPIVNKMEPGAAFAASLISMCWTGYEVSNEAGTFYRINRANNWTEFTEALKTYAVPAQNFVYGDDQDTIGYYTGGKLPIRSMQNATLPADGTSGENDWKGFVPFQQMPHCVNPPQGFIATANNKIVNDSYPYYISNNWEPPWRSMRLNEVLREQPRFSVKDFEKLQCDVLSLQAREIVPILLHAFDSTAVGNTNVKTALEYLRNWNDETRKEDVATTIFQATMDRIIRNTFADKMGEQLFALYDTLASTPLTVITRLLKEPNSPWFDDSRTPEVETKDMIIRKSLTEAVADLQSRLGGEPKEWQWGRVHTVTFVHVFGVQPLLGRLFNVGPYAVGGTHATVSVGQYFLSQPFVSRVGPSMRQIMNLADVNDTRVVLPPGQSGNLFYKHYKDQIMLWLNGAYRDRPMEKGKIEAACSDVLRLRPAE